MEKVTKIMAETARIIVGPLFVFSGFVKSIDPLGTAYKIGDYLHSFHLDVFSFLALPGSILLSAIELFIGLLLLMGMYRKFSTLLALLFMSFMTIVTFYLAIANPISDCGCFGDALILTNWETFWKNIFLLACTICLVKFYKRLTHLVAKKHALFTLFVCALYPIILSLYCYGWGLPLIDFLPYKIGNTISPEAPAQTAANEIAFETTLIYEKEGVRKEFTIDNYPADDLSWTFIDAITVEKGGSLAHHAEQFILFDNEREDVTLPVLTAPEYTFLLISRNLKRANESTVDLINSISDYAAEHQYHFYGVTASSNSDIEKWGENTGSEYPFLKADETLLKSIIRSNPGLLLVKEGKIVYKWSSRQIPDEKFFNKPLDEIAFEKIAKRKKYGRLFIAFALLALPLGTAMAQKNAYEKKQNNSN